MFDFSDYHVAVIGASRAGIANRDQEDDFSRFSDVIDINLTGSFRMANVCLPLLKRSRGTVVNIGSMYGNFGSPRVPAYGASKAAIHQLTRSLKIFAVMKRSVIKLQNTVVRCST